MKVKLNNVRLAFPQLFEAKTVNGEGEPAFSASFLMDPKHPAIAELKAAFEAAGKEKWGAKWPTVKKEIEAKDRLALHDGVITSREVVTEHQPTASRQVATAAALQLNGVTHWCEGRAPIGWIVVAICSIGMHALHSLTRTPPSCPGRPTPR